MSAPSTAELVLRMVVSLAIMGGLAWLALRIARGRRGLTRTRTVRDPIEVCARRQLSRSTSLALVRVGERTLLLSVAESGARVLADGRDLSHDAADLLVEGTCEPATPALTIDGGSARTRTPGAERPTPARMAVLDALRDLTVRR